MDTCGIGTGAIANGVGEVDRTVVVACRGEGDGAVRIERYRAVVYRYGFAGFDRRAVDLGDGQWVAVYVGVVFEDIDDDRLLFACDGAVVNSYRCVVFAVYSDAEGGGGGQPCRIFDGVGEDVGLTFAVIQRLCRCIRCVGVAAVGVEGQGSPCAGNGLPSIGGAGSITHLAHTECIAVGIAVVGQDAAGRSNGQGGIFVCAVAVIRGNRCVIHTANVNADARCVCTTFTIADGVVKVGRAVVAIVRIEGNGAIRIERYRTVIHRYGFTGFDRRAVDFSDGQFVAIRIFVVAQYVDGNRGVFLRGDFVVRCYRRVIDRSDLYVNLTGDRSHAVGRGVGERSRAVVVLVRCEGDGAVAVERGCAVCDNHGYAYGDVFAVNLRYCQLVAIHVQVIGQYVNNDRRVFRCGRHIIRNRRGVRFWIDNDIKCAAAACVGRVGNGRYGAVPVGNRNKGVVAISGNADCAYPCNGGGLACFDRYTIDREGRYGQYIVHIAVIGQYVARSREVFVNCLGVRCEYARVIYRVDCDMNDCT